MAERPFDADAADRAAAVASSRTRPFEPERVFFVTTPGQARRIAQERFRRERAAAEAEGALPLELAWHAPDGAIAGYTVEHRRPDGATEKLADLGPDATRVTVPIELPFRLMPFDVPVASPQVVRLTYLDETNYCRRHAFAVAAGVDAGEATSVRDITHLVPMSTANARRLACWHLARWQHDFATAAGASHHQASPGAPSRHAGRGRGRYRLARFLGHWAASGSCRSRWRFLPKLRRRGRVRAASAALLSWGGTVSVVGAVLAVLALCAAAALLDDRLAQLLFPGLLP